MNLNQVYHLSRQRTFECSGLRNLTEWRKVLSSKMHLLRIFAILPISIAITFGLENTLIKKHLSSNECVVLSKVISNYFIHFFDHTFISFVTPTLKQQNYFQKDLFFNLFDNLGFSKIDFNILHTLGSTFHHRRTLSLIMIDSSEYLS